MNSHGHKEATKHLHKTEEFWNEVADKADRKELYTAMHVAKKHAAGERKKINWHNTFVRQGRNQNEKARILR